MYGVGSSPTLGTCETSQVLLGGVSGVLHGGDKMAGRENPLEIPKNGLKWFWSGVKEIDIVR